MYLVSLTIWGYTYNDLEVWTTTLMCLISLLDHYRKCTLLGDISSRILFSTKLTYFQCIDVHISFLTFFGGGGGTNIFSMKCYTNTELCLVTYLARCHNHSRVSKLVDFTTKLLTTHSSLICHEHFFQVDL